MKMYTVIRNSLACQWLIDELRFYVPLDTKCHFLASLLDGTQKTKTNNKKKYP